MEITRVETLTRTRTDRHERTTTRRSFAALLVGGLLAASVATTPETEARRRGGWGGRTTEGHAGPAGDHAGPALADHQGLRAILGSAHHRSCCRLCSRRRPSASPPGRCVRRPALRGGRAPRAVAASAMRTAPAAPPPSAASADGPRGTPCGSHAAAHGEFSP